MEEFQLNDLNDDFFTETLSEPSIEEANTAVHDYQEALNAVYLTYTRESRALLYSNNLEIVDEEELKSITSILSSSNYELSALSGEHVVIFHEPMLVSEVSLSNLRTSEAAKNIRLISYGYAEKKVTSKISSSLTHGLARLKGRAQAKEIVTFDVYDYVNGLILPKKCNFESVRAASIRNVIKDKNHIINIQEAYLKLKNSGTQATLAWQDSINKARDLIKEGSVRFEAVQNDVQHLNQQKVNLESRVESLKDSLSATTQMSNEIQSSVDSGNIRVQKLEERSKQLTEQYDKDKKEHTLISEALKEEKQELTTIRQELSEARRQKSLSNYESIAHTNEAKTQLIGYYIISVSTLIALCGFVIYLYVNATSFKDLLSRLVLLNASPWDILLSRLPLVTATALVVGALSAVLFFLIKQIVALNNEKMTMLKAGILAQQISDSLEIEGKSDTEIIQIKRDIKIKLITEVFDRNKTETLSGNYVKDLTELVKSCNIK